MKQQDMVTVDGFTWVWCYDHNRWERLDKEEWVLEDGQSVKRLVKEGE